uniref:Secreted protein n=1 Tax=Trichobilharzia regenti TaxID=157069 RepID=A0AA85KFT0_TRIRE|nr:unnamed protein product [Trichobilharzia regenti]
MVCDTTGILTVILRVFRCCSAVSFNTGESGRQEKLSTHSLKYNLQGRRAIFLKYFLKWFLNKCGFIVSSNYVIKFSQTAQVFYSQCSSG